MAKYGKWIGGGLGWALGGGPIGALLGFAIGSLFDKAGDNPIKNGSENNSRYQSTPNDFGASLLVLVAAVMKADGKVLKSELEYVKQFFNKQFGAEKTKQHLLVLRELLKKDIPIVEVCLQIKTYTLYPARLQLMHLLMGVAAVDNHVHDLELRVIEQIAANLGIKQADYNSIKAMLVKQVDGDYKILEISKNATNEAVKKAYRKMAVKYHPDKVSHMGDEYKEAAKEKFQKMKNAYDNIKKARGMN